MNKVQHMHATFCTEAILGYVHIENNLGTKTSFDLTQWGRKDLLSMCQDDLVVSGEKMCQIFREYRASPRKKKKPK